MEKKTVLVVEFTELPQPVRETVRTWCGFHNDCLLPARMEWDSSKLSLALLEEARARDDAADGVYDTLAEYCHAYNLVFEYWILNQGHDLSTVDGVYVNICW